MKLVLLLGLMALGLANGDPMIDRMLAGANDVSQDTVELMNVLNIGDIDEGTDAEDELKDPPNDKAIMEALSKDEGAARGTKGRSTLTRIAKQGGKMLSKAVGKLKGKMSKMVGKFKKLKNKATELGQKGWDAFKKANPAKAGKKMMKSVMKEFYEYGKEEAMQFLSAALMDWIKQKIDGELCECFYKPKDPTKTMRICRCCIKPPGFHRACVRIHANIKKEQKNFKVFLGYKSKPYLTAYIKEAPEEEVLKNKCSAKPYADKEKDICSNLPDSFHFLQVCVTPGEIEYNEDDDESFGGCFQIRIDKLDISFEKCLQYDAKERKMSFVAELE